MIIKNISGSSQDIDIGTAVVTVANNALVALDPGYRWQVNGIYGSKFRVATAAEVSGSVVSLPNSQIFVGNASNAATAVAMSGDATIANTGAVTIANNAVTTAKILNANVTLAKLAAGITPSHVVKFAGQPTTVGGAAAEAFTVTGALSTDLAFVQVVSPGTNTVSVIGAVVTADTLTVTFSADPGNDAIINYQLLRAAS